MYGYGLGLILALIISYAAISLAIKKEVRSQLEEFTGVEKDIIKRNLDEFNRISNLKANCKIIVFSKDKEFDERFIRTMEVYNVKLKIPDYYVIADEIDNTEKFIEIVSKLRNCDIVIFENVISATWDFNDEKIKKIFISLAENICDFSSLIYYGTGNNRFPSELIKERSKSDLISFANAPSQLHANILNMILYRDDMKINIKDRLKNEKIVSPFPKSG